MSFMIQAPGTDVYNGKNIIFINAQFYTLSMEKQLIISKNPK